MTQSKSVFIPTPFLICPNAVLTAAIRSMVTTPPSPERLPWKMLPELDAKAIASNKRLEQLRQERERNRAEAERLAAQRQSGGLFGSSGTNRLSGGFDFSSSNNQPSGESASPAEESSGSGFSFSVQSSGHRRKAGTEAAPKRRHSSITANFTGGSLQMDIFNHDK